MKREAYNKNWPRKNLGELANFLDRQYPQGIVLKDMAARTATTVQNLSQMFVRDDMKLSRAEGIVRAYGCRLMLYFPEKARLGLDYSPKVLRPFPNAGNLAGLARYIADSNISINHMSQRIGRANSVLTTAFTRGDIFISTMYSILANLGIDVIWSFEKQP